MKYQAVTMFVTEVSSEDVILNLAPFSEVGKVRDTVEEATQDLAYFTNRHNWYVSHTRARTGQQYGRRQFFVRQLSPEELQAEKYPRELWVNDLPEEE